MHALLDDADLFVTNVRGKGLERLGLDYASVSARRAGMVYVHCVGFGQDGPNADLQAYDDVIQAAGGVVSLPPLVDGNPAPRYVPSLIADKVSGLHAAYAAIAALFHRERTGEGQRVEVPMLESFASFMASEHLGGLTFDPPTGPAGYARQLDPDRQPFPTADGHISIVAYTYESWETIFAMLGDPDFIAQPQFDGMAERAANTPQLYRRMRDLTPGFTTAHLLEQCRMAQIPAQPVNDMAGLLSDPHLQAVGLVRRREHPSEGTYHQIGQPVRFGALPAREAGHPPRLDQHGDEIRAELAARRKP
jgi:crotonobetainyl-CoA:carnitine CoA-transferase CaiB-like acyl-CoA transferase